MFFSKFSPSFCGQNILIRLIDKSVDPDQLDLSIQVDLDLYCFQKRVTQYRNLKK